MAFRGILLALLPALYLGFTPTASRLPGSAASASASHSATRASTDFGGLVRVRTRGTSHGLRMAADGPSLVEQPVTADEAIELIGKAKTIIEADMGVKAAEMLSPDFRFLWQFNGNVTKADYLTEGKGPYATLRTALPDLFWNSYDYRVDKYNRNRVWATTRLTGTHNGPLVFDGKEYPPSGRRVEAAPECVSVVFDETTGLATKMTGGFCLDRGAGNTGPAGCIWGVLQAIGEPVPAWKYFPPVKVAADVVGPTFRPKKNLGTAKLPFREAVAIALAKQVLAIPRDGPDPLADLLADDFTVYAPIFGPLKKKLYVQSTAVELVEFFSGLDFNYNFHDARVDPFEPSRVWVTSVLITKVVGPISCYGAKFEPKKQSYLGTPSTFSVTFDSGGYVSKITLGCPMDTEVGETGGLTNFQGILAGLAIPLPDAFGRPVPESIRRFVSSIIPAPKPKPAAKKPAPAPAPKPAARKPALSEATTPAPAKKATPKAKAAAPARPTAVKKPAPVAVKKAAPVKPATKPAAKPSAKPAAKPATKAAAKPAAKPVAKPAARLASKPAASPQQAAPAKPAGSTASSGSPFGGMFNFGGSGGATKAKEDVATAKMPETLKKMATPTKTTAKPAAKKAPAKKTAPAKPPAKPAAAPAASSGSSFGGMFSFGGSGGVAKAKEDVATAKTPEAPKKMATPTKTTAKPAAKKAPAKKTAPAKPPAKPAAAAASSGSPFGGMFSFGGSGGGGGGTATKEAVATAKKVVAKQAKKETPKEKAAPAPAPAPAKKAKPSPAAAAAPAGGVTFSPALAQKLEEALGSTQRVDQLAKRTELFVRGGISAMDYWSTLKTALGPDGTQNLGPDIIGTLPPGNQKSALFKIFSTG
ncbi:unnamed protein product [Pylaiella littoralis]